jgi:hypothetical protein
LNSEKIWKIWKKGKLNSEMIWKILKIYVLVIITPKEISSSYPSTSCSSSFIPPSSSFLPPTLLLLPPSHPPPPYPPLTDISNVVFQMLRFEKVRGKGTGK